MLIYLVIRIHPITYMVFIILDYLWMVGCRFTLKLLFYLLHGCEDAHSTVFNDCIHFLLLTSSISKVYFHAYNPFTIFKNLRISFEMLQLFLKFKSASKWFLKLLTFYVSEFSIFLLGATCICKYTPWFWPQVRSSFLPLHWTLISRHWF